MVEVAQVETVDEAALTRDAFEVKTNPAKARLKRSSELRSPSS